jgi:cyclopropane-fatty-acyl-phospholipid synthase
MDWLLHFALAQVTCGNLQVTTARGATFSFGDGTGPPIAVRFVSARAQRAVLLDPDLRLGEAYMDGTFVVDLGSIAEFVDLMAREFAWPWWAAPIALFRFVWRRIGQLNGRGRSRRNVAHHYDLDGRLYSLFLDSDRQYSCAYFETPQDSLDDAQLAKKRHLVAKLILEDGHRLLDIGCGWGGLALYAAEMCGARVTGVTLSQEQLAVARQRAKERKLEGSAAFQALDYRDVAGSFDRIVSVGMFEHVGVGFYDAFFAKCASILADDGVMVLHSIGRSSGPGYTNAWIAKYIFPGGYIPALSEVTPAIERAGPALRGDPQGVARPFPRAPRRGCTALRRPVCAHVGILSRLLRGRLPTPEYDGHADSTREASGHGADHPRLYPARRNAPARTRSRAAHAAAARRRVSRGV